MKFLKTLCVLCLACVCQGLPVSAQGTLVLSAVEGGSSTIRVVTEVLTQAYQQLGIHPAILQYPGRRGLDFSNKGETDGEAFRIKGIEKAYPNLIRVEVSVMAISQYFFVKPGKEFVVDGWDSMPKDYVLGYQRGVRFIEQSIAKYGLRAEAAENASQLLLKLDAGRNDVIVVNIAEAKQKAQQLGLQNIVRLEPPFETHHIYHYLHKKHAALVPKITAVLKEMEANGDIQKIQEQIEAEMVP